LVRRRWGGQIKGTTEQMLETSRSEPVRGTEEKNLILARIQATHGAKLRNCQTAGRVTRIHSARAFLDGEPLPISQSTCKGGKPPRNDTGVRAASDGRFQTSVQVTRQEGGIGGGREGESLEREQSCRNERRRKERLNNGTASNSFPPRGL